MDENNVNPDQSALSEYAAPNNGKPILYNIYRALGNAELRVLIRTFFPWDA